MDVAHPARSASAATLQWKRRQRAFASRDDSFDRGTFIASTAHMHSFLRFVSFSLIGALLVSNASGCLGGADASEESGSFAQARKSIVDVTAREHVVAFTDGFEASSDKSLAGPVLRVMRDDGSVISDTDITDGLRGVTLGADALATLQLTSTIADQHVVIRPYSGTPTVIKHEDTPIALGADATRFVWIEAKSDLLFHLVDLSLVEASSSGEIVSRTHVDLPEESRRFFVTVFAPFPRVFDLLVEPDVVHLGWSPLSCNRSSEVFRIQRATGAATLEWRGAVSHDNVEGLSGDAVDCGSDATGADEVGQKLALLNGELVVAGSTFAWASVVANAGFIARRGETIRTPEPLSAVAGNGKSLVVAHGKKLERYDGTLSSLGFDAPNTIEGVALDDTSLWIATWRELIRRPLP